MTQAPLTYLPGSKYPVPLSDPPPPKVTPDSEIFFHRLMRHSPAFRWFKPLLVGLLGFVLMVVGQILVMIPLVVWDPSVLYSFESFTSISVTPESIPLFLLMVVSVIVMIPALWLGMLAFGFKPTGFLFSVAGRVRWRWLGFTLLPALGFSAVLLVSELANFFASGRHPEQLQNIPYLVLITVLVVVLVPLQATAEELVFRGYFMQLSGSYIRQPVIAVIVSTALFGVGHVYSPEALINSLLVGLATGWLSYKTGGIEAAVSLHVLNNVTVFLLVGWGIVPEVNSSGQSDPSTHVVTGVLYLIFVLVVLWLAKRQHISAVFGKSSTPARLTPVSS